MRYEIVLAPAAAAALKSLSARLRATVRDHLERHLRHQPTRASKSRIKRLRGLSRPQYRLRILDMSVFYDVTKREVQVLAIVSKAQAQRWLEEEGAPDHERGTREG